MIVGYNMGGYPEKRNIINKIVHVEYFKVINYYLVLIRALNKMYRKLFSRSFRKNSELNFYFDDLNLNRVDIHHFFNYISYGKIPWVSTFETIIPRSEKSHRLLNSQKNDPSSFLKNDKVILEILEKLAGDPCKKLIALSECSLNMQKAFLQHFPDYFKQIEPKLVCLHPPQELHLKSWHDKELSINGQIHFMFVGGLFFLKGGNEILDAFQELRTEERYNIKLTIISNLVTDDYATNTTEQDRKMTLNLINKNKDWIDYISYLPNSDVLRLMKTAHVGLLPTYADTYGYSVLEFQALGCPVISTNVRALNEINNNEIGWLINVPKNKFGGAFYSELEDRKVLSDLIKEGIKHIIPEIMNNKKCIIDKSNKALTYIEENHSPEKFSAKLLEIYNEAIN